MTEHTNITVRRLLREAKLPRGWKIHHGGGPIDDEDSGEKIVTSLAMDIKLFLALPAVLHAQKASGRLKTGTWSGFFVALDPKASLAGYNAMVKNRGYNIAKTGDVHITKTKDMDDVLLPKGVIIHVLYKNKS
jgi:hypothetical protein